MIQTGLEKADREMREAADGMAAAIGEEGRMATQAADEAKRYKEQRQERNTLNRMKNFLMNYKGDEKK